MKRILLETGDITRFEGDAIVNAANSSLMGGGGVDGAIHRAGGPAIMEECVKIVAAQGRLPAGKAVITTGGKMKAKFVIHTVGPVWQGGTRGEAAILRNAYINSLSLATEKGLASVAFPSISTGAYGYPVEQAAQIAVAAVAEYLAAHDMPGTVTFMLFDERTHGTYRDAAAKTGC
jgi:O-acetyl-ADP-ribose deacetylase (regulator of RNase III)